MARSAVSYPLGSRPNSAVFVMLVGLAVTAAFLCKSCAALARSGIFSASLRDPHAPQEGGEPGIAADWIPHRLVFIKYCDRSRG
jgi:hypothetical protein